MSHVLVTRQRIRATYTMLREFAPFSRWGLPPATEVRFELMQGSDFGQYNEDAKGRHVIAVNPGNVHGVRSLVLVVAHEMTHMRQHLMGKRPVTKDDQHNATFNRLGLMVCRSLFIDPADFF